MRYATHLLRQCHYKEYLLESIRGFSFFSKKLKPRILQIWIMLTEAQNDIQALRQELEATTITKYDRTTPQKHH
jgi:hypothetical protein